MSKPKFSIVLICRNEAKMIPRMYASLKEFVARGGDVNIVDTGSTDGSPEVARSLGIRVKEVGEIYRHTITPELAQQINERFTVGSEYPVVQPGETYFDFSGARNAASAMADCDHVCTMDCDEMMTNLNIDVIDQLIESDPALAHFEYNFIFNHDQFGNPVVKFIQSKFYNRKRMEWRGIIHELVTPTVGGNRYYLAESDFLLEHFQNPETNRSQYLRGLAVDCFNNPNSDRNSHYFAREMWYTGRPFSAAQEFKRHVDMNRWPAERAESLLFMADIAGAMGGEDFPPKGTEVVQTVNYDSLVPDLSPDMTPAELKTLQIHFCHLALQVEPLRREPLIKLAQIYGRRQQWQMSMYYAVASLELPWYPFYGANEAFYKNEPHELIYRAAGWLGDIPRAQKHLLKCLEYNSKHPDYLRDTQYYWEYGDNGIEGWMEFPALTFLYNTAKLMREICEVGSFKGKSTHALLSGLNKANSERLHTGTLTAVDHWEGSQDPNDLTHTIAKQENIFEIFKQNTAGFEDILRIQKSSSLEAANKYTARAFDMVFIDAGHTYEEVVADIRAWKSKALILLCGHDYWPEVWPGVVRAVDEELGGPDEVHGTLWVKWLVKPKVSICIPTLGRPEKLHRLLEAIKKNAEYDNYEVIVKADQMPPNNLGAPKMLAKCVEDSTGELVMFLGNDCVPEPGFLREAVWSMARHFANMDGMIGLNDQYWNGDKGHVATHWLASKKLLPYLGGEFFHTGYHHTGCDNELMAMVEMAKKYRWERRAKIFHDHPINNGFTSGVDELYEQAYAGPRHEADDALYAHRSKMLGFANRKWS